MNVIEEVKDAIDKLEKVELYLSSLGDRLSILDMKQQDLLHYIENNKLKTNECYRIIKELNNIRIQRRKIKNDIEIGNKYNEHKCKLASLENRKFLLNELYKKEKTLGTKYKNKGYTNEEIESILKGV